MAAPVHTPYTKIANPNAIRTPCCLSTQNMPTIPVYAVTPPLTPEAQKVSNKQGRVSEKVIDREREKRKMQATAFVHPIVAEPI